MTHHDGQRWTAVPASYVTKAVLDHREDPAFIKRFYEKVDVGFDTDDCHIWTGALSDEGYGNFTVKRYTVRAHRVSFLLRYGDAVGDLLLDHVDCLGRFCVNPEHLEPVTPEENTRRGRGTGKLNQRFVRNEQLLLREAQRLQEEIEQWRPTD